MLGSYADVSCGFPECAEANTGLYIQTDDGHFFANPFPFIFLYHLAFFPNAV
jgi:hypothetical protein